MSPDKIIIILARTRWSHNIRVTPSHIPTPHYFSKYNNNNMAYLLVFALLFLRTHAPLQSIYSELKGRLARHVAGRTSFTTHTIRDLILTSTNGLKFRILFSLGYTQASGFVADAFAAPAILCDRLVLTYYYIIEHYFYVVTPYKALGRKRLLAEVLSPQTCATGHRSLTRVCVCVCVYVWASVNTIRSSAILYWMSTHNSNIMCVMCTS